ncbi:MAG: 3-oxoacyl-ACP reductase FabG [Oscillospiraceae bacterium]|jgi:NAD(P)-dependent dehydrogenase (short-subunit alcohol dehydrogenase family)|nr:3-oxoacyl-ACP reductase FabG [Oscillospiraceae bacterium]
MGALTGKYAVVTGAGRGIGAAIAKRFITENAAGVAILDYDGDAANAFASAAGGNHTVAVACDVSDRESVRAAFERIREAFGRVDILVNNAGITRDAIYHKMTDEQWDAVINVNLGGVHNCCRQVVAGMRERGYGKIVNISSSSAYGNVGQANYAATKAGLIGFTKTLAKELGGKNVTVNAVAPGMIDTDMVKTIPEPVLNAFIAASPAKRLGTPEEVAGAVLFLSCGDSAYVNGVVLDVNGGLFT